MTWNTMSQRAHKLGFKVACPAYGLGASDSTLAPQEIAAPPSEGPSWVRVGNYGQMAVLWAQPMTSEAQGLPSERIVKLISTCCPFVGTMSDYDADFQAALAPQLAMVKDPERGRMPA